MAFKNEIIDGGRILLKVGDKYVAYSTQHELSIEVETKETKYKQTDRTAAQWVAKKTGMKSWSISCSAFYSATVSSGETSYLTLAKTAIESDGLTNSVTVVSEFKDENNNTVTATGSAIIKSIKLSAGNVGEEVTYSVELEGTGSLVFAEITA